MGFQSIGIYRKRANLKVDSFTMDLMGFEPSGCGASHGVFGEVRLSVELIPRKYSFAEVECDCGKLRVGFKASKSIAKQEARSLLFCYGPDGIRTLGMRGIPWSFRGSVALE